MAWLKSYLCVNAVGSQCLNASYEHRKMQELTLLLRCLSLLQIGNY